MKTHYRNAGFASNPNLVRGIGSVALWRKLKRTMTRIGVPRRLTLNSVVSEEPMDQILIMDPNLNHGQAVAHALRPFSYRIALQARLEYALALIERQPPAVIVFVADTATEWYRDMESIRHMALRLSQHPRIVCLLRGPYRGPSDRVYAARKGFQVVYER